MNCTGCGAPLAADTLVCPFCGLHNAVDLLAIRDFELIAEHSALICPNGCGDMQQLRLKAGLDITVGHCPQCKGLMFAPGALQIALEKVATQVREINHGRIEAIKRERLKHEEVRYRNCPACRRQMLRKRFNPAILLIVDECVQDGVWLDGGEFSILAEWTEAGGVQEAEAAAQRRERVDVALGNISSAPIPPIVDTALDNELTRSRPASQIPAWIAGLILTAVMLALLGLNIITLILAGMTVLAWFLRNRL